MLETSQLARPQASESRIPDNRPQGRQAEATESSDFDRQLNDHMDQARSTEKPDQPSGEPVKSEENQASDEYPRASAENPPETEAEPEQQPKSQPESPLDPQPAQPPVVQLDAEQALTSEDAEAMIETDAGPVAPVAGLVSGEQTLPQAGKNLPPATVAASPAQPTAEVQGAGKAVTNSLARAEAPTPPLPATPQPPPMMAEKAAAVEKTAEFVAPEFSLQLKNRLGKVTTDSPVTAKTSLNLASAAAVTSASLASSLQQVPLASATAAMHNHGASLISGESLLPSTSTPTLSTTLSTPVQNAAWSQGVAERVAWMAQGQFQSAEIKLNPANLGPLEIKLSIQDDNRASVHFVSNHAAVRDALDSAMPRLREMLESQGLDLADVNVSDSGVQGGAADTSADQQETAGRAGSANGDAAAEVALQESMVTLNLQDGVSIYA